MFKVASIGLGVQSSCFPFMIQDGILEPCDLGAVADTGSERPESMALIDVLKPLFESMGIEFRIAKSHLGKLHEYYQSKGAITMIGAKHCTVKFKIRPLRRLIREYVGNSGGTQLAEVWLGITTDEDHRMHDSDVKWVQNRYPFIELGWSRQDCIDYLRSKNLEVRKSGCFMCPYQSGDEWVDIRENHPELWNLSLSLEDTYFSERPERWKGLRYDGKKLRDDLESFAASKCSSGGCFI